MSRANIRERIIEASLGYMAKEGCRFSVDEMVKSMNMSKRTFYRYYESKERLLMALVDLLLAEIHEKQAVIYENEMLSVEEKLLQILTVETKMEEGISYRNIYAMEKYYPEVYRYFLEQLAGGWELAESLLKQGMEQGIFAPVNVSLVKTLMLNGMWMLCRDDFLEDQELTYREALYQTMKIIVDGIRATK